MKKIALITIAFVVVLVLIYYFTKKPKKTSHNGPRVSSSMEYVESNTVADTPPSAK